MTSELTCCYLFYHQWRATFNVEKGQRKYRFCLFFGWEIYLRQAGKKKNDQFVFELKIIFLSFCFPFLFLFCFSCHEVVSPICNSPLLLPGKIRVLRCHLCPQKYLSRLLITFWATPQKSFSSFLFLKPQFLLHGCWKV